MALVSYAQNFEDVLLWRALGNITQGFYIDIGAQHPVLDSVSLAFYEQCWRGMHVDASAAYCELLRAARPDEQVIQAAVGSNSGLLTFYEFPGTGLSTLLEDIAEQHRSAGFDQTTTQVPCTTLDALFDAVGVREVHWLKIDVEGNEAAVIEGWRQSAKRPWIIVIEAVAPFGTHPTHDSYEGALLDKGYRLVYFDGLNRYYVSQEHSELSRHFNFGPSLWDEIQVPKESRMAQHLLVQHAEAIAALEQEGQLQRDLLASEIGDLVRERDDMRQQSAKALDLLARAEVGREELAREVAGLRQRYDEMRDQRDRDAAELAILKTERESAQQRAVVLASDLDEVQSKLADAQTALGHQAAELAQANTQLADAHQALSQSREDVERLMSQVDRLSGHLEAAVSRRRYGARLFPFRPIPEEIVNDLSAVAAGTMGWRNGKPPAPVRNVDELIKLETSEFLQAAFQAVLGRAADAEGLRHYARQLACGQPREQILCDLAASAEGRQFGARLSGLDRLLRRRRLLSQPLLGPVLRLAGLSLAVRTTASIATIEGEGTFAGDEDVRRILTLRGSDFLRAAYALALDREPDRDGMGHFLQRLSRGDERIDILAALRWSPEGRAHRVGYALARATEWYRWRRWWLVGRILRDRALRRNTVPVQRRIAAAMAEMDALEVEGAGLGFPAPSRSGSTCLAQGVSRRRLSVGFVTTWNVHCGIATHSAELAEAFEDANVRIYAADQYPRLAADGPDVFRLWHVGKAGNGLSAVVDHLCRSPVDLLIIQFNYGFFNHDELGDLIDRVVDLGIVVMIILHSTADPMGNERNWRIADFAASLQRCGQVIVHSAGDVERLSEIGVRSNVLLMPHGIAIRDDVITGGGHREVPLLTTFGFCFPNKGLVELVEAIGLLRDKGIHVQLRMLNALHPDPSSAEALAAINRTISRLELSAAIEVNSDFLDFETVDRLIAETELFVNPYQQTGESASGAVRIGLRMKRPTIVTPLPIFDDLGDAVFRMPGTSAEAMAEGIAQTLDDISNASEKAQQVAYALDQWLSGHDFRQQARRLAAICHDIKFTQKS